MPHVPQFEPSVLVSVHIDPPPVTGHRFGLAAGHVQWLVTQLAPVAQTVAQPPQWDASVAVFTQTVPHTSGRLVGHLHEPVSQMSLVCGQGAAVQLPQWCTSVWVLVQKALLPVPHLSGLGARHWQDPVAHCDPGSSVEQRWPQLPQLSASMAVSTHCGERGGAQEVTPGSQSHEPATQLPRPQA